MAPGTGLGNLRVVLPFASLWLVSSLQSPGSLGKAANIVYENDLLRSIANVHFGQHVEAQS